MIYGTAILSALWIMMFGSWKIFAHVYTIRVLESCDQTSCFISSSHVNENIGWQIEPCFCVKLSPTERKMFLNQINVVKTSVVSWHPIKSIELICITWPKTSSLMLLNPNVCTLFDHLPLRQCAEWIIFNNEVRPSFDRNCITSFCSTSQCVGFNGR